MALLEQQPMAGILYIPLKHLQNLVVNSLGFAPVAPNLNISITLMAGEGLCEALLDNLWVGGRCDSHRLIFFGNFKQEELSKILLTLYDRCNHNLF